MVGATGVLVASTGLSRFANAAGNHREYLVEIRNLRFVPEELEVAVGDTIRWINQDISPHTATALDGEWDTQELIQGQSHSLVVTQEMAGEYYCLFHPHMRGKIRLRQE